MTRQKALKEQYLFSCSCPRCMKLVTPGIYILCYPILIVLQVYYWSMSHSFIGLVTMFKGQSEDIQESAVLEGYRCEDDNCMGFLLRDPGTSFFSRFMSKTQESTLIFFSPCFIAQIKRHSYVNNVALRENWKMSKTLQVKSRQCQTRLQNPWLREVSLSNVSSSREAV